MAVAILAWVMVTVGWCIPGRPHRWARVLMAERRAGRAVMACYCPKCAPMGALHVEGEECCFNNLT